MAASAKRRGVLLFDVHAASTSVHGSNSGCVERVKRRVVAIGQDPKLFAGHSLWAGLNTLAAAGRATERDIMQQTRQRGVEMVRVTSARVSYSTRATGLSGH